MERLVSSVSKTTVESIRRLPQRLVITRGIHKSHRESFLNASSANYIDESFEQWLKDPSSVHKVDEIRKKFQP